MIANPPALCCFPPAALNGGPLDTAPPKVGEWVWQPKVDDWRAVIHTPTMTVWNQYGKLSSITDKFSVALNWLRNIQSEETQYEWLDVGMMENRHDLMRGCIIVFDLIVAGQEFWLRRERLEAMFPVLPVVSHLLAKHGGQVRDAVYLISQWEVSEALVEPIDIYQHLQAENERIGHKFYEGLVAKKADSLYAFGRAPKQTIPTWIKHRFDQGGQS